MEKIKSISEAFSTQPVTLYVCENYEHYYDKKLAIKEIKIETLTIGELYGNPVHELYCVGYNFEGKKLFQYVAKSVNIHFYPS